MNARDFIYIVGIICFLFGGIIDFSSGNKIQVGILAVMYAIANAIVFFS